MTCDMRHEWFEGATRADGSTDFRWLHAFVKDGGHKRYVSATREELRALGKPGQAGLFDGKRKKTVRKWR